MRTPVLLAVLLLTLLAACRKSEQAVAPATQSSQPATATAPASSTAATATGIDVGSVLPAYGAAWLDGTAFDLASRRDKVVLLNVWATWCGPCRFEIPELQSIHDKFAARGFEVIGVSVDEGDPKFVREFVAEKKMTYPVALDSDGKIADMLQTSVLPTTVLLGRDGTILWKKYGAIEAGDTELAQAIEKAL